LPVTAKLSGGILSVALSVPIPEDWPRELPGIMPCGARTFLPAMQRTE